MKTTKFYCYNTGLATLVLFIALSGCSSTPKSTTLPVAKSTMTSVGNDSGIVEYSSLELRVAKDKLEQAENAAKDDKNHAAERFAQEALVNLELAKAKAESRKSAENVEEMEKAISTLRNELERAH